MQLLPDDQLGRYRILGPLGEGGMGVVFRARDTELGRDVAIKVLPEPVASDPDARARFEHEARAVASLSHPNVLTIHDFGRSQGIAYAVTELLDGESLRERLARGPLPWQEAVEIAGAVATGLAAAHERGIVHRDIKPANVFLTGSGQVKILDFGIARRETPHLGADDASLPPPTRAGIVLGTVGYMSPEQAMGQTVDPRTDLFSLGCILYEMLSGRRPFLGATAPETMLAIVNEDPPCLAELGCQVPPVVEGIVSRCLAKSPEQRPASAAVLAALLHRTLETDDDATSVATAIQLRGRRLDARWIALAAVVLVLGGFLLHRLRAGGAVRGGGHGPLRSVAVLPFADLTPGAEDYFADGMTDAVIAELGRIQALKVISRTSVLRYKGTTRPIPEIGKELDVDAILEGSVTRSGDRVRVIVELIEAKAEGHLLSHSFEKKLADVLTLQREIATAVADEIRVALTPEERTRLTTVARVDPEAEEAYLRGHYFLNQRSIASATQAVEQFQVALVKDPGYALAYAGLAQAHVILGRTHVRPAREDFAQARAAAERALELDPGLAEAHTALGIIGVEYDWDWSTAEDQFVKAAALSPGEASVHQGYSDLLISLGRFDQAIARAQRALELDPVSAPQRVSLGSAYYFARRFEEGAEQCHRAIELNPDLGSAWGYLSLCLEGLRQYDQALDAGTKANLLLGIDPGDSPEQGHLYAAAGRAREARAVLDRLGQQARSSFVPRVYFAQVQVGLGLRDEAMASLEAAHDAREPWMRLIAVDPRFDPLHDDPRFQELVRRMGLSLPSG